MYRKNKKKLAISVLMFFVTLMFSNFTSVSAFADTVNNSPFSVTTVSTSSDNSTYTPVSNGGDNVSTSSNGEIYFRMDFNANNPQPGDTITFTLPSPLANINLIHYPSCFNQPTINGDTVTLVANDNIQHVVGGYLTVQANYDVNNGTQSSNIPVVINGNKTTIHVTNTTYNPNYNDGSGSGSGKPEVNPIDEGGSIVKTVNGSSDATLEGLNSTNNILNYEVKVDTTKMTVDGIFKDVVTTPGVAILPNTIKIVNDANGQDITNELKPNMTVNSTYENSSITIKNFPKGGNYTVTYNGEIDINYPGIKDTAGHYLDNTASIGGASSTASIYVIVKSSSLTQNQIKGLTTKTVSGSDTYSNLGDVKQFNLVTNYNNYLLPPGLTVADTMPEGLQLDPNDTITGAFASGANASAAQGPINIIKINKDGVETRETSYKNAIANLYVNYQINKIELITNVPTNNSFWISYHAIVSKPFKANITNSVKTTVGTESGTASASIHYSASDGLLKAWKTVNKKTILPGESNDVQYGININSVGSFPIGYLNIKDPLAKGITFENVQLPQGFTYSLDKATNTLNIVNTEPIIGAQGEPYNSQIIINASLANAKDGTTIDNTAYVNNHPTDTVKTKKGYAFTAVKEAAGTNKTLEGAVYGVYNSENQQLYTVTSDANGVMTGSINATGNYYLKEITAPKGYSVSNQEIPFTITSNDIGTTIQVPTIYDTLAPTTGNIEIIKTNKSGDLLQGAVFAVEQNGKIIQSAKTNNEGVAEFTGLPIGTYTIVETQAPVGYQKDTNIGNINVEGGQTNTKKIIDKEIKGKLEITKESSTGQKLEGAVFSITGPNGYSFDDATTGTNGTVEVDNLAWGTYTITEIKAPIGYNLNSTPQTVTIGADNASQVQNKTFVDKQLLGQLQITKEGPGEQKLAGAEFTVTGQNGFKPQTITTNADGIASLDNLPWGTYTVKETKAPQGYELNGTPQQVVISNASVGGIQNLTFKDAREVGSLQIVKEGPNGQKLAGAEFTVEGPNGFNEVVTTNADGVASLNNLAWGTYTVKETKAPQGYALNDTVQTVNIDAQDVAQMQTVTVEDGVATGTLVIEKTDITNEKEVAGAKIEITGTSITGQKIEKSFTSGLTPTKFTLPAGTYTYKEVDAPTGYNINTTVGHFTISEQGQIVKADIKDSRILGSLAITKTGKDGVKLAGAEFTVEGPNGFSKVVTTNKDGVASLNDLAWGTYTVKETKAPVGYSLNKEVKTIDINADDATQVQSIDVKDGQILGQLQITKVGQDGAKLAGAEFTVEGPNGFNQVVTTNADGVANLDNLAWGTYTVKETKAPEGYTLNSTIQTVQVTEASVGNIQGLTFKDARKVGSLQIVKEGPNGQKLAGAEFTVEGPNGFNEVVTTNADGVASLNNLAWGTYTVKETKAPQGYALNDAVQTINIDAQDVAQMQTVTVKDGVATGTLVIEKTDITNEKEVAGAKIEITGTSITGQKIEKSFTSGLTPTKFTLPAGNYTYKEVDAPTGYNINTTVGHFTISEQGQIVKADVKDSRILGSLQIVKTGVNNSRLQGAEFTVEGPNGFKQIVTTDKDGVVNLSNLAWGTYKVQETKAPAGYNLDAQVQTVTIDAQDAAQLQTVLVNDAETTGTLEIEKTDITNEKEVAGAKIQIEGTSFNGQKVDITFTSGLTPTKFTLPAGNYTYKEVDAPTGYNINTTVGHFTISEQGQIVKADVKDTRILGKMSITKTNANGTEKLDGAQFTVEGPNGFKEVVTTNKDGVANLDNLAWGTYNVKETKAPIGYALNNAVQTVQINAQDASTLQAITVEDGVATGTLVIEKTDITNEKEVAGAKIQITGTSISGEKIDKTFISGTTPTKFTLPAGTYTYKEVDAPTGYNINTTVGHFTISEQGQIVKADVKDSRILGSLQIIKTGLNNSRLQGAEFTVTGPNGFDKVVTTDKNGIANLDNLAWGTYTVKETKAPAGYNLNPQVQTVTIDAQDAAKLQNVVVNDAETTGTLEIEKTDVTNEKEVAGAKIQITGTSFNGQKVDITFTSGLTPTKFTLPAGKYTYKEVDAPTGYNINTTVGHFTISEQGQIVKADVKDTRILGKMSITKTGKDGVKLEGAEFTVTGPNGFDKVITTNKDGVANLDNLAWGTYKVQETKAPVGYNLNNEVQTVNIDAQDVAEVQSVTVNDNQILGQISITKTNENGTKKLEGAQFTVEGPNGFKEVVTTNKDGVANLKDLAWGTYKVQETKAPVGYNLNNEVQTVNIDAQNTAKIQSVTEKDTATTGTLVIEKTDITNEKEVAGAKIQITGTSLLGKKIDITFTSGLTPTKFTLPAGNYTYKEVDAPVGYLINTTVGHFTISEQGQIVKADVKDQRILGQMSITKTNENGTEKLEGAQFTVTGPNGFKEVVTTNKDGVANLKDLAWGTYKVQETKAPVGYNLNNEVQTVNIDAKDTAKMQSVTAKDTATIGTLVIEKTDVTNEKEVAGAKIQITGTSLLGKKIDITFTSGLTPTKFTLPAGNYTYKEVDAPVGYLINTTVGHFTISEQGQIVKADVKDQRILGQMSITKTNENGTEKLEGAEFTVTGPNGFKEVVTTNKNGVASLDKLAWGTYTVKETKAPIGYSLNNEIQTVKIDAQDTAKIQSISMKDAKILGQISVVKTNENGNIRLVGAEFTVTGPNGFKEMVTTNKDGVANLDNLAWGTYKVQETKAPIGYALNNEIQTVEVTAASVGKVQSVSVKDKQILGNLTITKTNENGTEMLQGAEFRVTGPNGFSETVTTGTNGIASLSNLEWGTYYVKEIKAPQGYNINNTIYTVNINAQDVLQVQAIKVKDSLIKHVSTADKKTNNTNNTTNNNNNNRTGLSPQTGDSSQLPIYILLTVAIIGLVLNTRRKKKVAKK